MPAYKQLYFATNRELTLLLSFFIVMIFLPGISERFAIYFGSISLFGILTFGAHAQLRKSSLNVWNPLVWFRASTAVFFGIGNLIPYLGNAQTHKFITGLYDFTDAQIVTVIQMTALCAMITLFIARFFFVCIPSDEPASFSPNLDRKMLRLAILFLIVGGAMRYGVVLPSVYGSSDLQIPGWMRAASGAHSGGMFLLTLWTLRQRPGLIFVPLMLVAIDIILGALAFDKSEVAFSLLFVLLAFLHHRFNMRRALIGASLIFGIIYLGQSPAHYGRHFVNTYSDAEVSLADRFEIISRFLTEGDTVTRYVEGGLNPLLRISYAAPAAFVVNEYNMGSPGNAHRYAFAALVPRILWSGKPSVGSAGSEVYYLIRGRAGASLGVGHFAEAYWSFGWAGAFIIFIPGGLMLSLISVISLKAVAKGRWMMFPVVVYGLNVGYKVSGAWVPGMVGGFVTFLVLAAIFWTASRAKLTSRRSHGPIDPYA